MTDNEKPSENEYSRINESANQQKLVDDFCVILSNYIPLSPHAIYAFCNRGMREWQIKNKTQFVNLEESSSEDRRSVMEYLENYLTNELSKFLKNKNPEFKVELAVKEAIAAHKKISNYQI